MKIVVGDLVIPSLQHDDGNAQGLSWDSNGDCHYVRMTDIFLVIAVSSTDPDILEAVDPSGLHRKIIAIYFKKCNVPT